MSEKKSNCCDTDNSDCNTVETNCCETSQNPINSSNKKKIGIGVLLIAITFAVISAFSTDQSSEKSSCSSSETSCSTPCDTGDKEVSCCSKK